MTRATIRIENRTPWRTDHLRAFVVRAREEVFGDDRKPLRVTFVPSRRCVSGLATVHGSWSKIRVPREAGPWYAGFEKLDDLKLQLAQILVHELAHNAGARGERWMRASARFGWGDGWRERVAWALALPLEHQPSKPEPDKASTLDARLAGLEARKLAWLTKAKRAATALRELTRRIAYYQNKLAAMREKP